MTATQVLLLVLLVWALIGVSTALVMGRRGHQPFTWLLLGFILGPLVVPVAISNPRQPGQGLLRRLSAGVSGGGSVDVLVGVDGSPESEAAARAAVALVGPAIGRLTLAGVVDYESAGAARTSDEETRATAALERVAALMGDHDAGTLLLTGVPAEALMRHATDEGYEVLVVGRRGRGASQMLLGSVATKLASGAGVPVLIV